MTAGELLIRVFSQVYEVPEEVAEQAINQVIYNLPKGVKEGFDREIEQEEAGRLLQNIMADKEGFKKSLEEDPGSLDNWLQRN